MRGSVALLFAAAIGLSAFLLFAVEPLAGRLVLPAFGGAPAAWATTLAFFQVALLLGYGYAHLSATRLEPRRGVVVHLGLVVIALIAFLVAPARFATARIETVTPALDLFRLLVVSFGAPALVLAASTPLLSAWLVAVRDDAGPGHDPYRLYALSNAGSLLAVIAYPFVIEPALGLTAQRVAFAAGFVLLGGLLVAAGGQVVRARPRRPPVRPGLARPGPAGPAIEPARVGRWLLLAAVPAGLLAAVTNFVATDLISAPLLWIGPLGTYLLTLVVAFSGRGPTITARVAWLVPIVVTLLWVPFAAPTDWPIGPLLGVEYIGFGIVALALHGRLAADRPAPGGLTGYYLSVAVGGAIGGSFVGLVAPVAFPAVWEYPILLVAALVAMAVSAPPRPPIAAGARDVRWATRGATRRLTVYLAVAGTLGVLLTLAESVSIGVASTWLLIGAGLLVFAADPRVFAVATAVVLTIAVATPSPALFRGRSFFGTIEVLRPAGAGLTILRNGTTVHGLQSTDPALRDEPAAYFSRSGPLGDIVGRLDDRSAGASRRLGVVGLGAGTIAAYTRTGDAITFFEIDPLVVRVAEDPAYFTYLADAAVTPRIEVGDGRLLLERTPAASFDLLVLDAFASDAIPIHLLTTEALADDLRTLAPGGLLAVHVSSRYYDLGPAVAAGVAAEAKTVLRRLHDPTAEESARGVTTSDWLVVTGDPTDVAWFEARGWDRVTPDPTPLTDDRSDTLRLLRRDALW